MILIEIIEKVEEQVCEISFFLEAKICRAGNTFGIAILKIGKMNDSKNLVTRCIFVHVVIKLDK